jgi:hypothetical protein
MEPTLPSLPLPRDTDGLELAREQALDYIEFVARNYAPDSAEIEIRLAASRLIEIITADYEATAREDAEAEAVPASPERTYFESLSPAKQDIYLELVGLTRADLAEFKKNRLQTPEKPARAR